MADKQMVHDAKGNFDDLRAEAVDPSDIDDDPTSVRLGKPRFLDWTLRTSNTGEEYLEAKGKDGKIYRIVTDEPPKPAKKGRVVIT